MSADWNFVQIDRFIYTLLATESDIEKVYKTVKQKFKWTDSQVKHAVDPLFAVYNKKKT